MSIINERDFPLLPSQVAKRRLVMKHGATTRNANRSRVPGSGATLNDLPDELILQVLSYLPGIDVDRFQISTLLSISLANRRLYRIVIGKVYTTYNSHFYEPYLFLRTMVSNPLLAEMVQSVDISYGKWAHHERVRYKPTAQDKKIIKEGMRTLAMPGWKNLATNCNENLMGIETLHDAVLMHIPNIASLIVRDDTRSNHRCPSWADLISKVSSGTISGRMHGFEHLQSLNVDIRSSNLSQLAPLFRLQSLRFLTLREIIEYGQRKERKVSELQRLIPPACNNLEELNLEHTFYSMGVLGVLLASPRQLKSFRYDVTLDHLDEPHTSTEVGDANLSTVLHQQEGSVENLEIFCDAQVEEKTRGRIHLHDSLKGFTSLQCLTCPLSTLTSGSSFVERLPPSLLNFRTTIRRCTGDQECLGALEHVAAHYRTHVPLLKEIRIVAPQSTMDTHDWKRLIMSFSETSITFVVEKEEEYGGFSDDWRDDSSDSSRSSDEVDLYSDVEEDD
ncbi:hypothetical protein EJ02DRAFT_55536 [Clathrospora elynae]|uniref:F-box domain-containing protein n=1 Tax=Clathrospora elynae TaxID=706981 RepID=A0A6A5SA62_9PLEO|nr:hypothetical protein EJ02DRAFT_55536 [Clathrospora elynae]